MKLAMIGSRYASLLSGACFADFGHDSVCVADQSHIVEANPSEDGRRV